MSDFSFFIDADLTEAKTNTILPLAEEYAWNFVKDCFVVDDENNIKTVVGNEAIKVWIYKALKTERKTYVAYSSNFGSDVSYLIGQSISEGEKVSELRRYIVECIVCDPYIKEVNEVKITNIKDILNIEFTVITIYGLMNIHYENR